MFDVAPGKEEEFRYLERSLALSDRLDRLIEATEPSPEPALPPASASVIPTAAVARAPSGLRAGFAARLVRLALILHREAATDAGLQPRTESPR